MQREWDAHEAAALLGCTPEQAEGTLAVLGYVLDEGRWKFEGDDAAVILSNVISAIAYAAHRGGDWQLRFRAWMERYLEGGEPPPLETLDLESQSASPTVPTYSPSAGERIDDWIARIREWRARGS